MEKFRCKLCSKQFVNGKALGGHMRSHLAALPLPPKTPPPLQDSGDCGGRSESTLSLCSEGEEEEKGGGSYGLRENPRKSSRWVDPEFFDRESESESTRMSTRRRSKRARRIFFAQADGGGEKGKGKAPESPESVLSSFSGEEEIARCLMMMSQDVWGSPETKGRQEKFQCEVCWKQFKSSQALGSHKTTHRKGESEEKTRNLGVKVHDQKMHECPFCKRVFGSGQALGGHKRSHLFSPPTEKAACCGSASGSGSGSGSGSCSSKLMIDLNLPAPMEDDDVSAVSDANAVKNS
ncbi:unnamed protein product [Cuscuta epithymum]|uniref:C2H2-type domain-containing protein n=1 Tax=Cuscuta epithymum TaxID=186058 RepID=A0AAV0G8K3_9ASTE|nr:unnamed protein product [Cuscuta epithymum]